MLTAGDISWIAATRAEITANRTVLIRLYRYKETGVDPFTGEPLYRTIGEESEWLSTALTGAVEAYGSVDVVWKEFFTNGAELEMVGGVKLEKGDVRVTFPVDFDFANLACVENSAGIKYVIVAKDGRGLGGNNRIETVARRVT